MYPEEFEAHWIGVAYVRVHLSGPGVDAAAQVEIWDLAEPCARRLMQAYVSLVRALSV